MEPGNRSDINKRAALWPFRMNYKVHLQHVIVLILLTRSLVLPGQGFTEIATDIGVDHSFTTEEYGGGVSFADFNGDGLDDLTYASDNGNSIHFHINTGGNYQEIEPLISNQSEVKQVLWVDYDNDGDLDFYLTSVSQNRLFKNNGDLELVDITTTCGFDDPELISYASTWMDYDHDGLLDLFVAHRTPEETGFLTLYRNMGNDQFEDMTLRAGLKGKGNSVLAMTSLDFNNDGWTDLFLAQDWGQGNQLLKNQGNGVFKDVSALSNTDQKMNSMTATIGDYNGDGWVDIYVTNTNEGNILLKNNGDETFNEVSDEMNVNIRSLTFGSAFFDADNDGDLDLQIVGFNINYLYENVGSNSPFKRVDGTWLAETDKQFNNGLAIGDYNSDGYVDLARNSVSREDFSQSTNTFLRNDFSANNHLIVNLEGFISNKNAIGSQLHLHLGEEKMLRRVAAGESFGSQHSYSQFFGVGAADIIDSLVVFWPSGNVSTLRDVSANQEINITEPSGGCTDVTACNYNPDATDDNGTCRYATAYMDCLGCISDEDEDGVCDELEIPGCTDINSCSYSVFATDDDGSCEYLDSYEIIGESIVPPLTLTEYEYEIETSGSTYEWSTTNGSIVLGQGTSHILVIWHEKLGGTISLIETDNDNCTSLVISKNIQINSFILNTKDMDGGVEIYPNPADSKVFIDFRGLSNMEVTLTDISSKVILSEKILENNSFLATGHLNEGIYILKIISDQKKITKKIAIKH